MMGRMSDHPEACGENGCICYCTHTAHPCGCDCPRDDDGELLTDG